MIGVTLGILFMLVPEFYSKAQKQDVFVSLNPLLEFNLTYLPNGNSFDKRYLKLLVRFDSATTYIKNFYIPDQEHKKIEVFLFQLGVLKEDNIRKIIPLSFSNDQLEKYSTVEVTYQNKSIEKIKINDLFLKGKKISIIERALYFLLTLVFSVIGLFGIWLVVGSVKLHIEHYQKTGETLEITNLIAAKLEGFKYVLRGFKSENKDSEI
ncbi:hypothetical protein SAMN03080594_101851 [Arenibacter palladensis]|uniref:Uncharacterized protein n=1 Tax=Arenibacter palladensis TaxID=237373 RepID=A0A1M4V602_9FLAO|nr:hypothetical protein [Arenibacter palladensis]SHE64298.1 hypothetical protein SAMN03080594_101851 [Arenibacter palladensis]